MCEQDYENKKLVITKFSLFLQTQNSNVRRSANRALCYEFIVKWLSAVTSDLLCIKFSDNV